VFILFIFILYTKDKENQYIIQRKSKMINDFEKIKIALQKHLPIYKRYFTPQKKKQENQK